MTLGNIMQLYNSEEECLVGVSLTSRLSISRAFRPASIPIADVFRGYKYLWFLQIKHVPQTFITANLISHACMLQKSCYSTKIKSTKTFLKGISAKIYTLEIYTLLRY